MKDTSKIFLICGSGGVGKTTVSAALGLKYALKGHKAIVLTIDPARRLATSLGISELDNSPKKIEISPSKGEGELWAMMLDTKRTFDMIVEKYAPSPEAMSSILNNRIYQHMSQMLAGTQEYMAMEKLYEIYQEKCYDVIVLDTPPMQNAVEFLAAPQRMINMVNNSMLQLLLKPTLFFSKSGFKILEKGTKQIFKVLDRIAGLAFLQELSEMFILLKDLLGGFQARADRVNRLLSENGCQFVSVCTTNENSISETEVFKEHLEQYDYRLENVIVNRVYEGTLVQEARINALQGQLKEYFDAQQAELLIRNYHRFIPLVKHDRKRTADLAALVGKKNVITVPLFLSDVYDLEGLGNVAAALKGDL